MLKIKNVKGIGELRNGIWKKMGWEMGLVAPLQDHLIKAYHNLNILLPTAKKQ